MKTFFAVCNANGPVSRALTATTLDEAVAEFEGAGEEATRGWIDEPATDAESHLDVCGDGMTESEFDEVLTAAGLMMVYDLSTVVMGHGSTCRISHLAGGWALWQLDDEDAAAIRDATE